MNNNQKDAHKLMAQGYRKVSNAHRIISRIDREDWKNHMAISHSPWSLEEGLSWVECLGDNSAPDHYRRCHSKDQIEGLSDGVFRFMKPSGHDPIAFCHMDSLGHRLSEKILDFKIKINNPSAWQAFSQEGSDMMEALLNIVEGKTIGDKSGN